MTVCMFIFTGTDMDDGEQSILRVDNRADDDDDELPYPRAHFFSLECIAE